MKIIFIILLVLFVFIYNSYTRNNIIKIKETFFQPRNHIIGPTINGLKTSDDQFQIDFAQNIDPFKLNLKNNNVLLTSYQNNNHNTLNDYNIRESIIYASIKEILAETKIKLNNYTTPQTININRLNNSNIPIKSDAFNPIINVIFNSINAMANNAIYIKPIKIVNYDIIYNKEKSVYLVDYLFNIDVLHPMDVNQPSDKNYVKNKLPLQIIIKFIVNNNITLTNNSNIYINDLSVIIKN